MKIFFPTLLLLLATACRMSPLPDGGARRPCTQDGQCGDGFSCYHPQNLCYKDRDCREILAGVPSADGSCALCGDRYRTGGEECDGGGESVRCNEDCTLAACGDGKTNHHAGEECDDGASNFGLYGGCTAECMLAPRCGDGAISDGELCDDGPDNTASWIFYPRCNDTCSGYAPYCGDGILHEEEECDLGTSALEGCTYNCTLKLGWQCTPQVPAVSGTLDSPDNTCFLCQRGSSPVITQQSAARGGPSTITLEGRGFCAPGGTVTVGGLEATVLAWSESAVVFAVPPSLSPGVHQVELKNGLGKFARKSYELLPWISEVAPRLARVGASFELLGTGFGQTMGKVFFEDTEATVTSWTDTKVTVTVPPGLSGRARARVEVARGTASNAYAAWVRGSDMWVPPETLTGRHEPSVVWTGSEMLVYGGVTKPPQQSTNLGARYDPATKKWRTMKDPPLGIGTRRYYTTAWTGQELLVWGGSTTDVDRLSTGARYDPIADTWTEMAASPLTGRIKFAWAWTGTELLIWGGISSTYLADGARYDPATDRWTPMNQEGAPIARENRRAIWTGTELLIWDGWNGQAVGQGARYNPATDRWTPITEVGAPAPRYTDPVWTGTEMLVWSGNTQETHPGPYLDDGALYNPATDTWRQMSREGAPIPRWTSTVTWTGRELLIFGGRNESGRLGDGGRYDPVTDTWSPMSVQGAPRTRGQHGSVWTGTELVVFGGSNDQDTYFNDGGHYDPATDTWSPLGPEHAPKTLALYAAAFTGRDLLLFGGTDGLDTFAEGSRYNHLSDTWSALASDGAPSARRDATAVWTGTEMIVWGGIDEGGGYTNSGARYRLATDTWQPLSTLGAPVMSQHHTATYANSEMVVFGGLKDDFLVTHGRYNPSTDAWQGLASLNAPTPRRRHTAVRADSLLVVYGGEDETVLGGRYNPASNTWAALDGSTENGGPGPLALHTAAWTGTHMAIFGGYQPGYVHSNGLFFYNPDNDTWAAVADVPLSARISSDLAWTGSELIIFGGGDANGCTNTGARYNPTSGGLHYHVHGQRPTGQLPRHRARVRARRARRLLDRHGALGLHPRPRREPLPALNAAAKLSA